MKKGKRERDDEMTSLCDNNGHAHSPSASFFFFSLRDDDESDDDPSSLSPSLSCFAIVSTHRARHPALCFAQFRCTRPPPRRRAALINRGEHPRASSSATIPQSPIASEN